MINEIYQRLMKAFPQAQFVKTQGTFNHPFGCITVDVSFILPANWLDPDTVDTTAREMPDNKLLGVEHVERTTEGEDGETRGSPGSAGSGD